jgi:hypothetical protein
MDIKPTTPNPPDPKTRAFYVDVMRMMDQEKIPYAVGGGYAMAYYTGIARNTKDLDIFVKPADRDRTLQAARERGHRTEFFFEFWIAKILEKDSDAFVDVLYSSGNGICVVDDDWFKNSIRCDVLGYETRLVPPEEQLWSKAFVQDRDRFDGADVNHLILGRGKNFDWNRLLTRFRGHERVLLAHVILFDYAYPSERDSVPQWVRQKLLASADEHPMHAGTNGSRVCFGTNLASKSYGTALRHWGFHDGRLRPRGPLTQKEVEQMPLE